ncbi:hypothetical protein HG619_21160 [Pseudomonas syringae]|nr:hypothetical protein [Pseudomonas syringae]
MGRSLTGLRSQHAPSWSQGHADGYLNGHIEGVREGYEEGYGWPGVGPSGAGHQRYPARPASWPQGRRSFVRRLAAGAYA